MKKIVKYTGDQVYMFPSGVMATKEAVLEMAPAALTFAHIIETDEAGEVLFALQNLSAMRSAYGIDPALSEAEAIAEIERIVNAPPPAPEPDATERIAAALEYQNISALAAEGFAVDETLIAKNYERGLWSNAMVAKTMGEAAVSRGLLSTEQLNAVSGGTIIGGGEIPSKMS